MSLSTKKSPLTRRIRNVGRFAHIVNVFARHGFWYILEAAGIRSWLTTEQIRHAEALDAISPDETSEQNTSQFKKLSDEETHKVLRISAPVRLRQAFEELGPAFIKLGQLLASRSDLIPEAFITELTKLENSVSPLPFEVISGIIKSELNERFHDFAFIDETPLAAGSIGQVHLARLKNNDEVVIKVQRPNIKSLLENDLSLMEVMAELIEKYIPEAKSFNPRNTIIELKRAIMFETDFVREAANTVKISQNFLNKVSYLETPNVYWELTTQKCLTISFIKGIALTDKEKIFETLSQPEELVNKALHIFLRMVFIDGFYHGDLHGGNLLGLSDGRLGILDFGICVQLSKKTREALAQMLIALSDEDYEAVVHHFVEIADPSGRFDIDAFEYDLANTLAPFMGEGAHSIRHAGILWELGRVAAKHGAPMPRDLIVFVKTFVNLEGVGNRLNAKFNVMENFKDFIQVFAQEKLFNIKYEKQWLLLTRELTQFARTAPYQAKKLLKLATEGELGFRMQSEDINALSGSLDRASARLAASIVVGALLISSSILAFARIGAEYYHISIFGLAGFILAGLVGSYLLFSILRRNKF